MVALEDFDTRINFCTFVIFLVKFCSEFIFEQLNSRFKGDTGLQFLRIGT